MTSTSISTTPQTQPLQHCCALNPLLQRFASHAQITLHRFYHVRPAFQPEQWLGERPAPAPATIATAAAIDYLNASGPRAIKAHGHCCSLDRPITARWRVGT
jgi:hypothetical protein